MSPTTIQRICDASTGASIDTIEQIATALGVTVTWLLTPSTDMLRAMNIIIRTDDDPPPTPGRPSGDRPPASDGNGRHGRR